jgi:osmotically-inducible protein OsmY
VRAVANLIQVQPIGTTMRNDTDLTEAVLRALEWDIAVPHEKISAWVDNGWITLRGKVALPVQRTAAEHAMRHLGGVRGVTNQIVLEIGRAPVVPAEVKQREDAEQTAWGAPGVVSVKDELVVGT